MSESGIDQPHGSERTAIQGIDPGFPLDQWWALRFIQHVIEWVRLKERHSAYIEEAIGFKKDPLDLRSPFTWSNGEGLSELEKRRMVARVKNEHDARIERARGNGVPNPLRLQREPVDIDVFYG